MSGLGWIGIWGSVAVAACGPTVVIDESPGSGGGSDATGGSVSEEAGSEDPDAATTETSSGSSGDEEGSDADTGTPGACNDGEVDPGEACDDGNEVDGDGCNSDCRISGELLWQVELDGVYASEVGFGDAGELTVGLQRYGAGADAEVRRFDATGAMVWSAAVAGREIADLSLLPDGGGLAYVHADFETTAGMLVDAFDDDGEVVDMLARDFWEFGQSILAVPRDGHFEAYAHGPESLITRVGADLQPLWTVAGGGELFPARDGGVFAVARSSVVRFDAGGTEVFDTAVDCEGPGGAHPTAGEHWIVDETALPELRVCIVASDGVATTATFGVADRIGTQMGPMAVDPEGNLIVSLRDGVSTRYVLEKHHPDLGVVWARELRGLRAIDVEPTTGQVAAAGDAVTVLRP